MITASDRFIAALAYSHESLLRVTIDGVVAPVSVGSLVADQTRNTLRTASMQVANDPLLPDLIASISTASAVTVEKGIRFLDRSTEYVTVGTMTVQEHRRVMTDSFIDIVLSDAGQMVDDYPIIYPWSPTSGGSAMTVVDAIKALVEDALPVIPTWITDLDAGLELVATADGTLYKAGTGRWSALNELAMLIGARVFADADGNWRIEQIRENTTAVHELYTGPGGVLVDATGVASRRTTFNGVAVEWGTTEVDGGIVLVTDDDVTSPTYWLGPWGKKPKPTMKLPLTTEIDAIAAATAELIKSKGLQSGLDLSSVYNPLLEPGDVVGVTQTGKAREVHVIDSLGYSLSGGVMSATTRVVSAA